MPAAMSATPNGAVTIQRNGSAAPEPPGLVSAWRTLSMYQVRYGSFSVNSGNSQANAANPTQMSRNPIMVAAVLNVPTFFAVTSSTTRQPPGKQLSGHTG